MDGVAPEDFYASTIYPTEVRVAGRWLPVRNQRMDGVVVVGEGGAVAHCSLFRALRKGDLVVTGSDGLRTRGKSRKPDAGPRNSRSWAPAYRANGASTWWSSASRGRCAGGASKREESSSSPAPWSSTPAAASTWRGWCATVTCRRCSAGNAIAVHDIEQALLGTSLGVDLRARRCRWITATATISRPSIPSGAAAGFARPSSRGS